MKWTNLCARMNIFIITYFVDLYDCDDCDICCDCLLICNNCNDWIIVLIVCHDKSHFEAENPFL